MRIGVIGNITKASLPDAVEMLIKLGGKYDLDIFDIDTGRCMFCALCVEACPYDALFMGVNYERASYTRGGLVVHIDELRNAKKMPSAFMRPNLEVQAGKYNQDSSLNPNEAGR